MGNVVLNFSPRKSLKEFTESHSKIGLIRKIGGKKESQNMIIHGENLSSLAALKAGAGAAGYKAEVDVIYIDPPYNVGGNQGYKNKWKGRSEKERDWAGDHGVFLDFMEPRLKIGRSLLKNDGVIFVSICDGEYCRLKILMDQIFGAENCMGTIVWDKKQGANGKQLTVIHEYILVYARNKEAAPVLQKEKPGAQLLLERAEELKRARVPYDEAQKEFKKYVSELKKNGEINSGESPYKLLHPETFQVFRPVSLRAQDNPERRCQKRIPHPITGKKCKLPKNGWSLSEATLMKRSAFDEYYTGDNFLIAGELVYGLTEENVPQKYLALEGKRHQPLGTVISCTYGGDKDLPEGITFSTPKPIILLKELIKSYPRKDITVLDYFAGSGATAHAVESLNNEDGGSRNWIMIEEMGSTFNLVLKKRLEVVIPKKNYGIYELKNATIGDDELMKVFATYSKDYIVAYHQLDDSYQSKSQAMNVVGFDPKTKQVVAIINPDERKGKHFFEKELRVLKEVIKKSKAKKALIYTINDGSGNNEEPWKGIDKHILTGTSCKALRVVEIPEQLVKEWNDVLNAMAA